MKLQKGEIPHPHIVLILMAKIMPKIADLIDNVICMETVFFWELLQKAENMTPVNNSFSLCRKKEKVFKLIADQQLLICLNNPMNPLKKTMPCQFSWRGRATQ